MLDTENVLCIVRGVMATKTKSEATEKKANTSLALVNEQGLTVAEASCGAGLVKACPAIVKAFDEYRSAENTYSSRFWSLAETLRMPQTVPVLTPKLDGTQPMLTQRLNGREITLLLLSLGELKQRVTEWKRVVEMDDESYLKCRIAGLSKVETLGVARGTLVIEGEGDEAEVVKVHKEPAKSETKPAEAKFHKFPKQCALLLHGVLEGDGDAPGPKATDDEIPYELNGTTADGRVYKVICYMDSKPVKPAVK